MIRWQGGKEKAEEMPGYFLLFQANHKYIQLFLQKLQRLDLKAGQAGILFMLGKCGPQSQREIADRIQITPPSVTAAVQKLEKSGLTEKRMDEKDQRRTIIEVTEKGREVLKEIESVMHEMEEIMFRDMSREEILLFRRLMIQMMENLEKGALEHTPETNRKQQEHKTGKGSKS